MRNPCIICFPNTRLLPRNVNNTAVPITLPEQVESTNSAFEAGVFAMHAQVGNGHENPSSDHGKLAQLKKEAEKQPLGMIIQFSTRGRSEAGRERGRMLPLCPEMTSQSVGLNHFPTGVYESPTDLVDR